MVRIQVVVLGCGGRENRHRYQNCRHDDHKNSSHDVTLVCRLKGQQRTGRITDRTIPVWCERGDSNPHGLPRRILSPVRLPNSATLAGSRHVVPDGPSALNSLYP